MSWKRKSAKHTPSSFKIIAGQSQGKPVVILDFGKLGMLHLGADDLERFKNELDAHLREAVRMGGTT